MGHPVVHFEIIGTDGKRLQDYYSELFGWQIDASNEMGYGLVPREDNINADGIGIGGGVGGGPEGYGGHVTFYVEVPDVEASLAKAESLGRHARLRPGHDHGQHGARPVQRPRGPCDRPVPVVGRRRPTPGTRRRGQR